MTYVRRDVWTLAPGDTTVTEYASAVALMKARSAANPLDPTGWDAQAAIHGTDSQPDKWPWNQCKHYGWFFLPWHRMYVWYFEQIVRAAVIENGGSADWALPYWNYGLGGDQALLPEPFRSQQTGGTQNPLYVATRTAGLNEGKDGIPVDVGVPLQALNCSSFEGPTGTTPPEFGGGAGAEPPVQFDQWTGVVENSPHNIVHDLIGGLMGDPHTAAQDPIFWLHHCNIDRIWDQWTNDAATHTAPTDPIWTTQAFSFYDANAAQVSLSCAEVLQIVAQLDYEYAGPPLVKAPFPGPRSPFHEAIARIPDDGLPQAGMDLVGGSDESVRLTGGVAAVSFEIHPQAAQAAIERTGTDRPTRIILAIQEIDSESDPGTPYGLYVNLPQGASAEEAARHYAGGLSFFGAATARHPRGDAAPHTVTVSHDITGVSAALAERGEWDGQHVSVTFRPIGLIPPDEPVLMHAAPDRPSQDDPPVIIGRVSVFYA